MDVLQTSLARFSENKRQVTTVAAISVATWLVFSKIYDLYFGPLSHIPGPFWFKVFGMRTCNRDDPPGTTWKKLLVWQEKYGPIVRLGPKFLLISDKELMREVLVTQDFHKGPAYKRIRFIEGNPGSILSSEDKVFHKQRRRILSPAFSVKYINSLEPLMIKMVENFIDRIDRDVAKTQGDEAAVNGFGIVDLWYVIHCMGLDIIGETAFGQTFHLLEESNHFVPRTIQSNLEAASYLVAHPLRGFLRVLLNSASILRANTKLQQFMKKIIYGRLNGGESMRRQDILQILIDSQKAVHKEDRLTVDAIAQETVLFLIAGSETTSASFGLTLLQLLRNPDKLARLRQEIDELSLPEGGKVFAHDRLKNLPYLNAVINEGLRMDPIVSVGLERETHQDTTLGGRLFLPKGTVVVCNVNHAHNNPAYWPDPHTFKPERWLPGAEPPPDTDAFFGFSAGSRNCIGKNFALMEIRLGLSMLVKLYDLEPIPEEMQAAEDMRAFITLGVHKNSVKVRVKRRQ